MNYLSALKNTGIDEAYLQQTAKQLHQRAEQQGFAHPVGVYHGIAVDLALAAKDIEKEHQEGMGKTHNTKAWFDLMLGL